MNIFGSILFATLCASWTWMFVSFPQVREKKPYLFLLFIQSSYLPLFLFSFWDLYNVNDSVLYFLSQIFLKLPLFFKNSFSSSFFLFSLGNFHYFVFQFMDPFLCIIYCWFLLLLFKNFSLFDFICLILLYVFQLLVKIPLFSSILLLNSLSIFMTITFNSLLEDCLSPLCLVIFLRFALFPLFGTYSSVWFYLIVFVSL